MTRLRPQATDSARHHARPPPPFPERPAPDRPRPRRLRVAHRLPPRPPRHCRHQGRLCRGRLRRLYRARRPAGERRAAVRAGGCLHSVPLPARRHARRHRRGVVPQRRPAPGPAGDGGLPRVAVRLLYAGVRHGPGRLGGGRLPRRYAARPDGQPVSLHRLPADPRRGRRPRRGAAGIGEFTVRHTGPRVRTAEVGRGAAARHRRPADVRSTASAGGRRCVQGRPPERGRHRRRHRVGRAPQQARRRPDRDREPGSHPVPQRDRTFGRPARGRGHRHLGPDRA